MQAYKENFLRFLVENGALLFGEFTLKSGRVAPYFINSGKFRTGAQIARLGEYYAACYVANGIQADALVGPAYKGIPLAVATAIALSEKHGVDLPYCFDRKEAKDHGEGGMFVGEKLTDGERVCIVEDVMTSGKALREILPKLQAEANVKTEAMLISVDRQEKGTGEKSAVQEAYETFGVKVHAIITMEDIIEGIGGGVIAGKEYLPAMRAYRDRYGA